MTKKEKNRKAREKQHHEAMNLHDIYIKKLLTSKFGSYKNVPDDPELIELKRLELKINRKLKTLKKETENA